MINVREIQMGLKDKEQVTFTLADRDGRPLEALIVTVECEHVGPLADDRHLSLTLADNRRGRKAKSTYGGPRTLIEFANRRQDGRLT